MRVLVLVLCVFLSCCLQAQDYAYAVSGERTSGELPPITGQLFSYYLVVNGASEWPAEAKIRFVGARSSSAWLPLVADEHAPEGKLVSNLGYIDYNTDYTSYELQLSAGYAADLHIFDPGVSEATRTVPAEEADASSACFCTIPEVSDRADWCPSGQCPPGNNPATTVVSHLIVHHSASPNSANDWAAVVRSFWNLHVNTNGWDDVGYNYLIDPNGVIYEGRGNNIRGAHFCGKNSNTMGVCVIGDFTNVQPSAAALGSLSKLLAWKLCENSLGGLIESFHPQSNAQLHTIAGHRQGCATACPGDAFFPTFPDLRQRAVDTLDACEPLSSLEIAPIFAGLQISPNPSSGSVRISGLQTAAELRVFDAQGRLVQQQGVRNGQLLPTAFGTTASAGVYHFVFRSQGEQLVKRVVLR